MSDRFAICIENGGYDVSLDRWKVYPVVDDADAEAHDQFRVVDESGESYLYPKGWFRIVDLPEPVIALYWSAHTQ
jgi:hypothetical protein